MQWPFASLQNRVSFDETFLSGLALGVLNSMGRTLAAVLAGVLVTRMVDGRKRAFWALIVAVLYVVDAPVRYHWGYPATSWDRLWQTVGLLFPAVACMTVVAVLTRLHEPPPA